MTKTVQTLLMQAAKQLKPLVQDTAKHETRLLLAYTLNETKEKLIAYPETLVSSAAEDAFNARIKRRLAHEPIAKIIGVKEFWGRNFIVSQDVLDPRPDSETLIETAIKHFPDKKSPLKILDLGTGSGCLLLTLLDEYPVANGVGLDISKEALKIAEKNATELGLKNRATFLEGDFSEINLLVSGKNFDMVITNPPYIALKDRESLDPEVREYDPTSALFGGIDGLDAYRNIADSVKNQLSQKGFLFVEAGIGQGEKIKEIFTRTGFSFVGFECDLSGIERCLIFKQK
ncbi:MAG: peptide chain release factor N(5)-glutamine methyltransferase [Alphaproteobacteria bacterium]